MNLFKELYLDIFSKHNDVANLAGYIVEEVVGFEKVLVGISVDGYPSILIKADKEDSLEEDLPPLNGIEAKFGLECEISTDEKGDFKTNHKSLYTIISYIEDDSELRDFFFNFFEDLLIEENNKNAKKIRQSISNLSKLFSHRRKPSRKTMMGLWSELIIILLADDSDLWAEKWHSQNRSTFDFEFDGKGVDVKSFGGHKREHRFQIEQLVNESTKQIIILSMCLKESDKGLTVLDLLDMISSKLIKSGNKTKLSKLLFSLAGKKITDGTRFNFDIAKQTLMIINGADIPTLNPHNTPLGVSEIKFKSDCSNIVGLNFDKENQDVIASSDLL